MGADAVVAIHGVANRDPKLFNVRGPAEPHRAARRAMAQRVAPTGPAGVRGAASHRLVPARGANPGLRLPLHEMPTSKQDLSFHSSYWTDEWFLEWLRTELED